MFHILGKEAKNEVQSKLSDNQTTQFPFAWQGTAQGVQALWGANKVINPCFLTCSKKGRGCRPLQ